MVGARCIWPLNRAMLLLMPPPGPAPLLPLHHLQVRSFKPDPEIYTAAEQLAGCSGPDLVFIDDKEENAAAAAARGWRAIHHTSVPDTLRQLQELGLPVVDGR